MTIRQKWGTWATALVVAALGVVSLGLGLPDDATATQFVTTATAEPTTYGDWEETPGPGGRCWNVSCQPIREHCCKIY